MSYRQVVRKPRVFIVTDISNEPDDAESLVRYLLYSNEFDTRGLAACTSTWMKRVVHPEDIEKIIHAYGEVVENLNSHVHPQNQYPSATSLLGLLRTGPALYGKEALEDGVPLSEAASLLIDRLEESDEPLWVLCWGGTNVLAQALQSIERTKPPSEARQLRSRMRVYAISDQDDTGMWIRLTYPDVFYIVSVHGWNMYGCAAWTGISGDKFYGFDQGGPKFEKVSKGWIKANIQIGPLGMAYPDFMFIPEGDTPTFLYLIQNGLGSPEHPEWGSWGGRYKTIDPGQAGNHYSDTLDRVVGEDGKLYVSNHATVWRWRDAYQNDFAARMQWTLNSDPRSANHAPIAIINDSTPGPEPLFLEAEAESELCLDASRSYDPDDDDIEFSWFHYKDVTATQGQVDYEVSSVEFQDQNSELPGACVKVRLPQPEKCAVDMFTGEPQALGQVFHFVLILKDRGSPPLTTYKRVVVQITNRALRGRRRKVDSIADVHSFD